MTSDPVVPKGGGALVTPARLAQREDQGAAGPLRGGGSQLEAASPPADGKANAEAERLLTGKTGASPSRVRVVRGLTGRDKTVFLGGVGAERVREVLASRPR